DVVTLADRERVAEYRGRVSRGLIDDARRLGVARARLARGQLLEGRDRSGPGPKILGREALPGQLLEQRVDVARRDGAQLAVRVEIAEQPLARQLVAAAQGARGTCVVHRQRVLDAAFAGELQRDVVAVDVDVALAQCRQAAAAVAARVLLVADADHARVEQT